MINETKSLYEKELDEYQKDLELAVRERDELEEKLKEKEMLLDSVGQEFEKHMAKLLADENNKWEDERKKFHEQIEDLREEVRRTVKKRIHSFRFDSDAKLEKRC